MPDAPHPAHLPEVPKALENKRLFRALTESVGWKWYKSLIEDECAKITLNVMASLPGGPERDGEIARYRTLKDALEKPDRVATGADSVIQTASLSAQLEDSQVLPP